MNDCYKTLPGNLIWHKPISVLFVDKWISLKMDTSFRPSHHEWTEIAGECMNFVQSMQDYICNCIFECVEFSPFLTNQTKPPRSMNCQNLSLNEKEKHVLCQDFTKSRIRLIQQQILCNLQGRPSDLWCTLVLVATTDLDSRFVFHAVDTFQRVNNKRSPVYDSLWNYSLQSKNIFSWNNFSNRVFHIIAEIGNNGNIGITGFTKWKRKKNAQWALKLRRQESPQPYCPLCIKYFLCCPILYPIPGSLRTRKEMGPVEVLMRMGYPPPQLWTDKQSTFPILRMR